MKRIILFALIALFSVSACKKDKKKNVAAKPVDQIIKDRGTWLTVSENLQYYDAQNNLISEVPEMSGPQYVFVRNTNTLRITENGVRVEKTYSFSATNGKNYISITSKDGTMETFEILSADSKVMTWQMQKTNVTYMDGDTEKTAAKVIYTIYFQCPCKD